MFDAELPRDWRFFKPSLNLVVSDSTRIIAYMDQLSHSLEHGTEMSVTGNRTRVAVTHNTVLKLPMALRSSSAVGSSTCLPT